MRLGIAELAILMVFGIPLAAIIGTLVLGALKILKGDPAQRNKRQAADETKMIQAIYSELSKMEDRIEALETVLIDRERKEGQE